MPADDLSDVLTQFTWCSAYPSITSFRIGLRPCVPRVSAEIVDQTSRQVCSVTTCSRVFVPARPASRNPIFPLSFVSYGIMPARTSTAVVLTVLFNLSFNSSAVVRYVLLKLLLIFVPVIRLNHSGPPQRAINLTPDIISKRLHGQLGPHTLERILVKAFAAIHVFCRNSSNVWNVP